MTRFVHPATADITLAGVLGALADPVRLQIIKRLLERRRGCLSCIEAAADTAIAKSTLSHHFRILREAGLIRTEREGVENRNSVRCEDLNRRFPGLLAAIMKFQV